MQGKFNTLCNTDRMTFQIEPGKGIFRELSKIADDFCQDNNQFTEKVIQNVPGNECLCLEVQHFREKVIKNVPGNECLCLQARNVCENVPIKLSKPNLEVGLDPGGRHLVLEEAGLAPGLLQLGGRHLQPLLLFGLLSLQGFLGTTIGKN